MTRLEIALVPWRPKECDQKSDQKLGQKLNIFATENFRMALVGKCSCKNVMLESFGLC